MFTSGSHATRAITFAPGGDTILVCDNIFAGPVRDVPAPAGCTSLTIRDNLFGRPDGALEPPLTKHHDQKDAPTR